MACSVAKLMAMMVSRSNGKTSSSVILSAAKDLEVSNMTRFFAALRMKNFQFLWFGNGL